LAPSASALDWEMDEFMIFGGWPWANGTDVDTAVKLYAGAGFNVLMGTRDKLDVCAKYGIKLIVEEITPEEVSDIKDHPGLWGYWIIDEPLRNMKAVRKVADEFHAADPTHPVYVNLVSRGGEYLSDYLDIVEPELLSWDYYEWWWGTEAHFVKLEVHRDAGLAAGVPVIRWVEVNAAYGLEFVGHDTSRPEDNEIRLRRSVFTSLAYGIRGIEWFTAQNLLSNGGTVLNDQGHDIAAINKEIITLGPVLMGLNSVDVFHTEPLPRGTKAVPEDHWVTMAESGYPNLVMGTFLDDAGVDYLFMSNANILYEKLAALQFREPVAKIEKFDKNTGAWIPIEISTNGVSEEAQKLIGRNLDFQMYSQSTGGRLIAHHDQNRANWFSDRTGNHFAEVMLAPGDGELLRVTRDLSPGTTRSW